MTGLYTYPFASRTANGFLQVAIPSKQVYEKLVTSQISSDYLSIKGSDLVDKVYVDSFDDLSVTLLFKGSANQDLFTATYIQGSPYIFITPKQSSLTIDPASFVLGSQDGSLVYTYQDKKLGVFSNSDYTVNGNSVNFKFTDPANSYVTIALTDDANFDLIKQYAANLITSVTSDYKIDGDKILQSYKFNFKYPSVSSAYEKWKEYLNEFGFGGKLGTDFVNELSGFIPATTYFDKFYGFLHVFSVSCIISLYFLIFLILHTHLYPPGGICYVSSAICSKEYIANPGPSDADRDLGSGLYYRNRFA